MKQCSLHSDLTKQAAYLVNFNLKLVLLPVLLLLLVL